MPSCLYGILAFFFDLWLMALFNEKWYNIESMRLKGWNYGSNGYYFVTFCAKKIEYIFLERLNLEK